MRRLKRVLFLIAAILFLVEAWLWKNLYALIEKMVGWIRLDRIKTTIAAAIEPLPAVICLMIFVVPVLFILPLKLLGVWMIGKHHIFLGISVFVMAKLIGLGIAAFLFETCRTKLLSLHWFLMFYHWILAFKAWSQRQISPFRTRADHFRKRVMWRRLHIMVVLKRLRSRVLAHARKK